MLVMAIFTVSLNSKERCGFEQVTNEVFLAILIYNDAQRKKAETIVHRMVKRAVEMEGTVTVSNNKKSFAQLKKKIQGS